MLYHNSLRTSTNWRLLVSADHGVRGAVKAQGYCKGGQQSAALLWNLRQQRRPVRRSVTILIGTNDLLNVSTLLSLVVPTLVMGSIKRISLYLCCV